MARAPLPPALVVLDEPQAAGILASALPADVPLVVESDHAQALGRIADGQPFSLIVCDAYLRPATALRFFEAILWMRPDYAKLFLFLKGTELSRATEESFLATGAKLVSMGSGGASLRATALGILRAVSQAGLGRSPFHSCKV